MMKVTQKENTHIKENNYKERFQENLMHQRRHLIIR
jgi:hypothetical protein